MKVDILWRWGKRHDRLCDAETSVAAPITSKVPSPSAVVAIILEGRSSLVTAYVLVLFNIMYGTIQLLIDCLLDYFGLIPGDYMYLQQDLFFTLVLGLAISYTDSMSAEELSKRIPPERFLTRYFLLQLGIMLFLIMSFQALSLVLLTLQSWYTPLPDSIPFQETYFFEASTLQVMALSQLMLASLLSSIGPPFRRRWTENKYHLAALVMQGAWILFQLFAQQNSFLQDTLQVKPWLVSFGGILLVLIVLQTVVCVSLADVINRAYLPILSQRWFDREEVGNFMYIDTTLATFVAKIVVYLLLDWTYTPLCW